MFTRALTLLLALTLFAPAAFADEDPYMASDDSWIQLSGEVLDADLDEFLLDYGDGVVRVELDDWDPHPEAIFLQEGDRVMVFGRVDADIFEFTKIEASSVFDTEKQRFYHASADDEEDAVRYTTRDGHSRTIVHGTVRSVNPDAETFVLDLGDAALVVETDAVTDISPDAMPEIGDTVSVSGTIDTRFFNLHILESDAIVPLEAPKG